MGRAYTDIIIENNNDLFLAISAAMPFIFIIGKRYGIVK